MSCARCTRQDRLDVVNRLATSQPETHDATTPSENSADTLALEVLKRDATIADIPKSSAP
ncbi:MAG: hypothetical protein RL701_5556 [Pseudomonadota bacterium]